MRAVNAIVRVADALLDRIAAVLEVAVAGAVQLILLVFRVRAVVEDGSWGWHCSHPERGVRGGPFYFVCPWCGGTTGENEEFSLSCCRMSLRQWREDNPDRVAVEIP